MIWLLADAIPQATRGEISSWIVGAAAVMSCAALFKSLFVRKPPIEAEFVKIEEFREFQAEVRHTLNGNYGKISDKIDEMKSELLITEERRAIALHERINDISVKVAAINERTKHL